MSRESIPELVTRLAHEGVAVAKSEIDLARIKVTLRVAAIRVGVILLVAAAVIAILGLIGLVVGCVLALVPLVGALLAGLIVLVAALIIAAILGLLGVKRLSVNPQPAVDPHTQGTSA